MKNKPFLSLSETHRDISIVEYVDIVRDLELRLREYRNNSIKRVLSDGRINPKYSLLTKHIDHTNQVLIDTLRQLHRKPKITTRPFYVEQGEAC